MKRIALSSLLILSIGLAFAQSTPPDTINYQGVLRDANDEPLDGSYGMVFRFFDNPTAGNEILVDTHAAVTVTGGLFNARLGSGAVTDGTGPGTYASLARVFGDYPDLYLEVEVNGENLSPRISLASAGHALNTRYVKGQDIVSEGPLDLYVNAITGDDGNDGLTPATAKQTIQAAVDTVPQILNGPATIRIADGTYNESVFIERRLMESTDAFLTLLGNETSPQNVVLDGQSTLTEGVMVLGMAEIRGIEVTDFLEEGLEVNFGLMFVENCRIIGNATGADPPWGGIGVFEAHAEIIDSVIANNGNLGMEIGEGSSTVELDGVEITGNAGHGIKVFTSSHLDLDGSVLIQNNGGTGVVAEDNSSVDFNGRADVTIQSNTGGSMEASYHSTIRGYGNGTVGGSCTDDTHSMCQP